MIFLVCFAANPGAGVLTLVALWLAAAPFAAYRLRRQPRRTVRIHLTNEEAAALRSAAWRIGGTR